MAIEREPTATEGNGKRDKNRKQKESQRKIKHLKLLKPRIKGNNESKREHYYLLWGDCFKIPRITLFLAILRHF